MKLKQFSELESMNHILVYKKLHRECKPSWWIFRKRKGSTGKTISGEIACVPIEQYLEVAFGLSTYSSDRNTFAFLSVNPSCLCKGKHGYSLYFHNLCYYLNWSFFPSKLFWPLRRLYVCSMQRVYSVCWVFCTRIHFFLYPFNIYLLSIDFVRC